MGKKRDFSDFECGMLVGARWAAVLSVSQTAELMRFYRVCG